jgi:type IV secretory pathway TraG/TraD family ATPase VirD4
MISPFRIAWELLRLATRIVTGLVQTVVSWFEQEPLRRGARAARSGLLGPYDPPPPPELEASTLDYRGLARPQDLALEPWAYRLGCLREPGRKWKLLPGEIGLPPQDIARHAAIIGPTGSGKTSSIVVPWIYGALGTGRSVLALDASGDLWPALRHYGEGQGKLNASVYHWDHRYPDTSSSWRWIDELNCDEAIEAAAEAILECERPNDPMSSQHRLDMRLLSALLSLSHTLSGSSAAAMLDAIGDPRRLAAFLSPLPQSSWSVRDLSGLLTLDDAEYARAVSGVIGGLRPLASPAVLRVSERPGFTLKLLGERPSLLIVGAPASASSTAQTTLGLIVALASQRWLSGAASHGVQLLLMLSDAPRVQNRVRLPSLLSRGAGAGLALVLTAQSVSQFSVAERDEILFNCGTMILLPGTDPSSIACFTERLGQRSALGLSSSVQRRRPWDPPQHGLNASNQAAPMLGQREICMPPFDGHPAIVHATAIHPQPILVDVTRSDL